MKKEGCQKASYCYNIDSDPGHRCLFNFLCDPRLFFNVFPFPVCNAKLIGDLLENRRSAPNCSVCYFLFFSYGMENAPKLPFVALPRLLRILTFLYIFCVLYANIMAHPCAPPPKGNADHTVRQNFFSVFGPPLLLAQGNWCANSIGGL